ncbi:MAG: hypothetical protein P0S95_04550 [Rhabdochlamydiaceae bacterium]|nr:hypothetical protein [Candidatus Amphrikana amoebophyrae]
MFQLISNTANCFPTLITCATKSCPLSKRAKEIATGCIATIAGTTALQSIGIDIQSAILTCSATSAVALAVYDYISNVATFQTPLQMACMIVNKNNTINFKNILNISRNIERVDCKDERNIEKQNSLRNSLLVVRNNFEQLTRINCLNCTSNFIRLAQETHGLTAPHEVTDWHLQTTLIGAFLSDTIHSKQFHMALNDLIPNQIHQTQLYLEVLSQYAQSNFMTIMGVKVTLPSKLSLVKLKEVYEGLIIGQSKTVILKYFIKQTNIPVSKIDQFFRTHTIYFRSEGEFMLIKPDGSSVEIPSEFYAYCNSYFRQTIQLTLACDQFLHSINSPFPSIYVKGVGHFPIETFLTSSHSIDAPQIEYFLRIHSNDIDSLVQTRLIYLQTHPQVLDTYCPDSLHPKMVRLTGHKSLVTRGDIKKYLFCEFVKPHPQANNVGNCFALAPSIFLTTNYPELVLRDFQQMLKYGYLVNHGQVYITNPEADNLYDAWVQTLADYSSTSSAQILLEQTRTQLTVLGLSKDQIRLYFRDHRFRFIKEKNTFILYYGTMALDTPEKIYSHHCEYMKLFQNITINDKVMRILPSGSYVKYMKNQGEFAIRGGYSRYLLANYLGSVDTINTTHFSPSNAANFCNQLKAHLKSEPGLSHHPIVFIYPTCARTRHAAILLPKSKGVKALLSDEPMEDGIYPFVDNNYEKSHPKKLLAFTVVDNTIMEIVYIGEKEGHTTTPLPRSVYTVPKGWTCIH